MTDEQRNNQDGAADLTQQQAEQPGQQEAKPKITGHIKGGASLGSVKRAAIEYFKEVALQATTEDKEVNDALYVLLDFLSREARANKLAGQGEAELYCTLRDTLGELEYLLPYLLDELQTEELAYMPFIDLAKEAENGESYFQKAFKAARSAREADRKEKGLRTAAKAGDIQKINIDKLAIPTDKDYLYALSLLEQGGAYMSMMKMDGLTFDSGKLYIKDQRARVASEMELQDLKTKEGINSINLPFLQFYYSLLYSEWERSILDQAAGGAGIIQPITRFYLPDLLKARGLPGNAGRESVEAIKNDIAAFHNVVGVLKVKGYSKPSYYPVLNFEGFDAETNTISISSPYLMHVVDEIYKVSVRRSKDGTPKLKNNGTPQTRAVNSYLVNSDIQKERNKAAVSNVFVLVQGIERCGENIYTIKASTLIERNVIFKNQLETNQNKNRLLRRTFIKTWELLRNKTSLQDTYKDIELPDPNNPACIPTFSQLDSFIIAIKHNGKKET